MGVAASMRAPSTGLLDVGFFLVFVRCGMTWQLSRQMHDNYVAHLRAIHDKEWKAKVAK